MEPLVLLGWGKAEAIVFLRDYLVLSGRHPYPCVIMKPSIPLQLSPLLTGCVIQDLETRKVIGGGIEVDEFFL